MKDSTICTISTADEMGYYVPKVATNVSDKMFQTQQEYEK